MPSGKTGVGWLFSCGTACGATVQSGKDGELSGKPWNGSPAALSFSNKHWPVVLGLTYGNCLTKS